MLFRLGILLVWLPQLRPLDVCVGPNRTTYLRTENVLSNELPALMLTDLTLNGCAEKCTAGDQGVECQHFEYNAQRQTCALKTKSAQPVGKAVLLPASSAGLALFQQICIPTKNICAAPYSFERFPQKVLVGHVMEVLSVSSLSSCLLECLESRERMHLDCKSVMYYYETGQCILNREQRRTAPHLFSSDTKFQLVDYFENNCYDVNCFDGSTVHWIRMDDFELGQDRDIVLKGYEAEQCRQACLDNKVGSEVFPCKAYVFTSSRSECRLSAETGMVDSSRKNRTGAITSELKPISAGQYLEKFCLPGNLKCRDISFDVIPNRMLDVREKVSVTNSLNLCLHECLQMAEECNSAMFFRDTDECVLNRKSQFSDPDLFKQAPNVDYFDNVCDYVVRPPKNADSPRMKPMFKPETNADVPLEKTTTPSLQGNRKKDLIETECRLDGIKVEARFEEPTSGAIFVKGYYDSCKSVFLNENMAKLVIPYPSANGSGACPGSQLGRDFWSFIVVVQKDLGERSAENVGMERVFNVTCDYGNIPKEREFSPATSKKPEFNAPIPAPTTAANAPADKVQMSILREGVPVTAVSLGEVLALKWTVVDAAKRGLDGEALGFQVEDCTAERIDGPPPEPAPLPLIVGGCPHKSVAGRLIRGPVLETDDGFVTNMKVFRFDGSRRVRIRCSINICIERCELAKCGLDENNVTVQNFGRRKRQTITELAQLLEQYDQLRGERRKMLQGETIEQSTAQGSYIIMDAPEEAQTTTDGDVQVPSTGAAATVTSMPVTEPWEAGEKAEGCDASDGHFCMRKPVIIFLIITTAILFTSQLFWCLSWVQNRGRRSGVSSTSTCSPRSSCTDLRSINRNRQRSDTHSTDRYFSHR